MLGAFECKQAVLRVSRSLDSLAHVSCFFSILLPIDWLHVKPPSDVYLLLWTCESFSSSSNLCTDGWMLFSASRCVQIEQLMSQCYFIDRSWFSTWWRNVYLLVSRIGHSKRWETSPKIDDRAWNEKHSTVVLAEETGIRADVRLGRRGETKSVVNRPTSAKGSMQNIFDTTVGKAF